MGVNKILSIAMTAAVFLGCGSGVAAQTESDWYTRGRSLDRGYYVPQTHAFAKLYLSWKRFFGERVEVEMEPLVVGNVVYLGLMNGKLYAIDADTGVNPSTDKWVFTAGGPISDTPTVATMNETQRIFFGSHDGKVYAVNTGNGQLAWSYQTGGAVMNTPAVIGSTVYFGSLDGYVYALNGVNGALVWRYQTSGPVSNSPAVGEITSGRPAIFIASGANTAYAFDAGGLVWSYQMQGVYTKRTMAVYGNGVAMFVTRKPGGEYSEPTANLPAVLQGSRQPGDTVISAWATYYQDYPDRRTLYYLRASDGADLWKNSTNKSLWTPLYIPYWGEYVPIMDGSGRAFVAASGSGGDHNLDHDIRMFRINLADGQYTQLADQAEFMPRFDEVGRITQVGSRQYQAIGESIGYYDVVSKEISGSVFGQAMFGEGFGEHRHPLEFYDKERNPSLTIFGGWEKWFTRFGSSATGAFGGGNDSVSPLVVAGNRQFVIVWGHLYALTSSQTDYYAAPRYFSNLDVTKALPNRLNKAGVKTEINQRIQGIVQSGRMPDFASRLWSWNGNNPTGLLWTEGEAVRVFADALPYLDEPLKTQAGNFLKSYITGNLLDATKYGYVWGCVTYPSRTVLVDCASRPAFSAGWWWENENLITERLYAIYRYALNTNDWAFVTTNWPFIRARYGSINHGFNMTYGFYLWENWHAGNFYADMQIAGLTAIKEMALRAEGTGGSTYQDVSAKLATMLASRASSRVGNYVSNLYATGGLAQYNYTDWRDWGQRQNVAPIPVEGYVNQANDFLQPLRIDPDGTTYWNNGLRGGEDQVRYNIYPYELIGFHPIFPETAGVIRTQMNARITSYVNALERINPWWYMGDYGHQVVYGGHEEDTFSIKAATDIFQAKAIVLQQTFEQLEPYLPYPTENYQNQDIYRLENLIALIQAPGDGTVPVVKAGDANNDGHVDGIDYVIWLNHFGQSVSGVVVGDFNSDNRVDGIDYVIWLNNYGA